MFDFGLAELIVIVAVAVLVIGPRDIPALMNGLGRVVRRLQYIRYAFTQQFEDFLKQSDLDELRRSVNFETQRRGADFDAGFDEAAADDEAVQATENEDEDDDGQRRSGAGAADRASD